MNIFINSVNIRAIKSRVRWSNHIWGYENCKRILVGKSEEERAPGPLGRRRKDNMKTYLM